MRMPLRPPSFYSRYPPWEYYYAAMPRNDASLSRYGASAKEASAEQRNFRSTDRMHGRGMYMGGAGRYGGKVNRFKKANKWTGFASGLASRVMSGQGTYTGNSLIEMPNNQPDDVPFANTVPTFSSAENDETGAIVISHKEYITDIYGNPTAGSFVNTAFTINPGLERTFPWLSQLASNFEEYELKQCIYSYRSLITQDNSSTGGQVGTVIMATNYNVGLPPFNDKATMMQYAGARSCRVTDSELHGVECDPSKLSGTPGRYTRTGPVLVNQDPKTYDMGLFQIAISGTPTDYINLPIGELWVSYTVVCRKPKIYTGIGSAISTDYWAGSTTCTLASPFGSKLLSGQQNCIGTKLAYGSNIVTVTFPATFIGVVRLLLQVAGSFTTAPSVSAIAFAGGAASCQDIPQAGSLAFNYSSTSTTTGLFYMFDVKLTTNYAAVNSSVAVTLAGVATNVTYSCLTITELNELGAEPGKAPVLINSDNVVVSL